MRIAAPALAVLLLAASGCLAPAPVECTTADCAGGAASLLPTVGLLEEAQLHGCVGGFADAHAPWQDVRRLVPAAFDVAGYTTATALLFVQNLACDRIVSNASVYSDISFVKVAAFVSPVNSSWDSRETDYYVLDFHVSAPGLAEAPVFGLPMSSAKIARPSLSVGPDRLETWTAESQDCSLSIEHRRSGEPATARTSTFVHWWGESSFRAFEEQLTFRYQGDPQAGVMRAGGACKSANAIGDAAPYIAHAYEVESSWSLSEQEFIPSEEIR